MRITELKPQFFRYEEREETYPVVDPAFVWNTETREYVNGAGTTWNAAGRPTVDKTGPREYLIPVDTLAEAQGITFLCPLCFRDNKGEEGTHHVQMPFAGRGVDPVKHVNQWNAAGTCIADLSTTPSYLIVGGCGWHGYITNGEATIV